MGIEPILSNIASIILQCMWLDLPYSKGHLHTMFSYEPTHLPILEIKLHQCLKQESVQYHMQQMHCTKCHAWYPSSLNVTIMLILEKNV